MPKTAISIHEVIKEICEDVAQEAEAIKERWPFVNQTRKLAARPFLEGQIKHSETTRQRLSTIEETLLAHPAEYLETERFLQKAMNFAKGPCNQPVPYAKVNRLSFLRPPDGEMARLNTTTMELFALAVMRAVERFPESFEGGVEDLEKFEQEVRELTARREALIRRLDSIGGECKILLARVKEYRESI